MSQEAAHDVSILLRVLNEKLSLEYTRIREISPSCVVSIAELEPEIESLGAKAHEVLRFTSTLWNALQPVNRLPPGVLSRIARCFLKDAADTVPMTPITHVCQYWRESIISAPENWTLISSYPIGLMTLALERSKAAPLHLWIFSPPDLPEFRDIITPHIQKIETLRFDELTEIEDLTQSLPNFPRSTPNLRSLRLDREVSTPLWDPPADPFESFPRTLRHLRLGDIPLYPSILTLSTLTELTLHYYEIPIPLDTLLDFLEENRSLEKVVLKIEFEEFTDDILQRRAAITNQRVEHLSIACWHATIARTLISSIPLQRGAHLGITFGGENTGTGLRDILSGISTISLPNLSSPTFMEYRSHDIRLNGPNGSFSYTNNWLEETSFPEIPFAEFPALPLTSIQELHLVQGDPPTVFDPSSFPALETLTIECNADVSRLFSALFPDPSSFPSLKTLKFLDCSVTEEFVEELARFASNRKNTTSIGLDHIVIVHQDGQFPTAASIHRLGEHVPIVDVQARMRQVNSSSYPGDCFLESLTTASAGGMWRECERLQSVPTATTVSLEPVRNLSIQDLLRVLNEKLSQERARIRDISPCRVVFTAKLESEIESLETRAREVVKFTQTLWNALRPVNRLPPEILSRISGYVLEYPPNAKPMVPITHTCRYWRESIISAPENWASICSHPRSLMTLALERSKAAPLHLWITSPPDLPEFRDLIAPHIQKIETLRFDELVNIEDFTQTLPNFSQSTPNLRSLRLDRKVNTPLWDPSTDPFESLPHTLRHLELGDIPLYPSIFTLSTLTELALQYYEVPIPLDTLLDFLKGNRSLEKVVLTVEFDEFPESSPDIPQRRAAMANRLQHLSITVWSTTIARALISNIPLKRGAHLEITFRNEKTGSGLKDILFGISTTHLPNLPSSIFMEYRSHKIRLIGPNGSFSYSHDWHGLTPSPGIPFTDLSVLPLTNVQELHLVHNDPSILDPSSFPALETLTVQCDADVSNLFSALFPDPSFFPSLKTLKFLDCIITEGFAAELTRFACDRKNTTSVWLNRVVIIHRDGKFPAITSIHELGEHVAIVDVQLTDTSPRFS